MVGGSPHKMAKVAPTNLISPSSAILARKAKFFPGIPAKALGTVYWAQLGYMAILATDYMARGIKYSTWSGLDCGPAPGVIGWVGFEQSTWPKRFPKKDQGAVPEKGRKDTG